MNKLFHLTSLLPALCVGGLLLLAGCSNDNGPVPEPEPEELVFELDVDAGDENPVLLISEETYTIPYHAEGVESIATVNEVEGWQVTVNETAGNIILTAPPAATNTEKNYALRLTATGKGNQSIMTEAINFYHVTFDEQGGTFVLNEGNMTSENGSLIYITPEGYMVDNAYKRVNGTELGNVTQDMYFHDGKVYIISQNGDTNAIGESFENDGMLVVADSKTLKKVKSFTNKELAELDWPTHIAVIDEQHVYIRDNVGIWHFNMDDNSLNFVTDTDGAPKTQFTVVGGKVYFPDNGSFLNTLKVINPTTNQVSDVANSALWSASPMINYFLGITPTDDGNLWVMGTSMSDGSEGGMLTISKLDLASESLVQNGISEYPNTAYNCRFAAHGNTVYYASGTAIYRANFNPEAGGKDVVDEFLVDLAELDTEAGLLYNGLGVNPITGNVFINTLKGFGNNYTTNSIWEFDFDTSSDTPLNKYDNYTRFPAGMYFNK